MEMFAQQQPNSGNYSILLSSGNFRIIENPEQGKRIEGVAVERLAELEKLRYPIEIKPNEDGEFWCPSCNAEIVGYYASYCEHCGQAISREYDD